MSFILRARTRVALVVVMVFVVAACGPSDQTVFDRALSDGRAALQADDLDAARRFFSAAEDVMPDAPDLLAAVRDLDAVAASQRAFSEAEVLRSDAASSLEAFRLFRSVPPVDTVRFETAQLAADEIERAWAQEVGREIDRLIANGEIEEIVTRVATARDALPSSSALEDELQEKADWVLSAARAGARRLLGSGDLDEAEVLLRDVLSVFPLSRSATSDEIRELQDLIPQERERLERVRLEEQQRRSQERLRPPPPPPPPPPPSVPAPSARDTVDGCPVPVGGDRLWEECLNERALAETGCPSVIYDAVAWERCVFGQDRPRLPDSGTVVPMPPPPPPAPAVECPVARARIVVEESGGGIRQSGAVTAELTVNLRGYVENQSSGLLAVSSAMYEFSTSGEVQAFGTLTWTDGNTLLQPGERRGFQVAGAQHTVTSRPDTVRIALVGPVLTAPTAELNARCPAQMPPVNSSFGTFSSSISFD